MDVITIGGVTIDAFLQIGQNNAVTVDHSSLCVRSGEKVVVDSCTFSLGGNACNVAVGLSRLGFSASLCAEIGTDEFAQKILNGLQKDHVDTTYLIQTPGAASSFAMALNVGQDRTLFVEHVHRKHEFAVSSMTPKWIYVTSLGEEWQKPYEAVLALVQDKNIHVAFNPGTRQLLEENSVIKALLEKTDILCVNKEEARKIISFYGGKTGDLEKDLIQNIKTIGPKIISLTDGNKGAWSNDEEGEVYTMLPIDTPIVERTGAGDAYATAFVAAQMSGETVPTAMQWGSLNAAAVIGSIGAQEGLLRKDELLKNLQEQKNMTPQKI